MDLHYFGTFFEMFAALNLGFAGSESFRAGFTDDILNINSTITENVKRKAVECREKIEVLKSQVTITTQIFIDNELIQQSISKIEETFNKVRNDFLQFDKNIENIEVESRKFVNGFQSLFLLSGLYCLYILLLEGYHQFYESNHNFVCKCLFISNLIICSNCLIFLRSFYKPHSFKAMKTVNIFLIFFFFIGISIFAVQVDYSGLNSINSESEDRKVISLTVLIAVIPYLFHILRVFIHKLYFRYFIYFIWSLRLGLAFYISSLGLEEINRLESKWVKSLDNKYGFYETLGDLIVKSKLKMSGFLLKTIS